MKKDYAFFILVYKVSIVIKSNFFKKRYEYDCFHFQITNKSFEPLCLSNKLKGVLNISSI